LTAAPQIGQKAVFEAMVLPHFEQYMETLRCEREAMISGEMLQEERS